MKRIKASPKHSFPDRFCSCCVGTRCASHFFHKIQVKEKGEISTWAYLLHYLPGAELVPTKIHPVVVGLGQAPMKSRDAKWAQGARSIPAGKRPDMGDSASKPTAVTPAVTGHLWGRRWTYLQTLVGQCSWSLTLCVLGATLSFVWHPFVFICYNRTFSGVNLTVVLSLLLFF